MKKEERGNPKKKSMKYEGRSMKFKPAGGGGPSGEMVNLEC
jgi:hypothetical protein